jgi:uncharacterized Zn-binding protein involved in type VI secretion
VLIGGQPASVQGDMHACAIAVPPGPHPPSPIASASTSVLIGGKGAARVGDLSGCGAPILMGCATVLIGA